MHQFTGGIPRLINLVCDRALLAGFSVKVSRITPEIVKHAATSLDIGPPVPSRLSWLGRRPAIVAGLAVSLLAAAFAVGGTALLYARFGGDTGTAEGRPTPAPAMTSAVAPAAAPAPALPRVSGDIGFAPPLPTDHRLPGDAAYTILAGSYPLAAGASEMQSVARWLEATGFRVYYTQVDLGAAGVWQRVLAGAYTELDVAQAEVARMNAAAPALEARVVTSARARGADALQ